MSNHTDSNEHQGESHHLLIVRDHYHVDTLGHIAERRCSCSLDAPPHRYVCAVCVDTRARASVAAVEGDGVSWATLLACLERLRSKNKNPEADWYNGWNAAIQCLINDINSRAAASSPASPVQPHVFKEADNLPGYCDRCGWSKDDCERLTAAPVQPEGEQEQVAQRIVGTIFDDTGASNETLKRTMIERITDYLTSEQIATRLTTATPPETPVVADSEREILIYWLLRCYESVHRHGWEPGPNTDETMDGLLSVLANRGYDPKDVAAKELLKQPARY